MTKVSHACPPETDAARRIKERVEKMFETGVLNYEKLAKVLGLLPEGARNMMGKPWGLTQAFRVAFHLGLDPKAHLGGCHFTPSDGTQHFTDDSGQKGWIDSTGQFRDP